MFSGSYDSVHGIFADADIVENRAVRGATVRAAAAFEARGDELPFGPVVQMVLRQLGQQEGFESHGAGRYAFTAPYAGLYGSAVSMLFVQYHDA